MLIKETFKFLNITPSSMTVFENVKKEDVQKILKKGYTKEDTKTLYEDMRFRKNDVTLILYNSGKLLLQGQKANVEDITKEIRSLHLGIEAEKEHFRRENGIIIGSDEVLKGDTFGGLVVAAVKADANARGQLIALGVADSKLLSDVEIRPMAEKIRKIVSCDIRSILPEEYNKIGKVTLLLNKLHKECAHDLFPGTHVIDVYPGCTVGDIRVEKAEQKYVEVAAASVLARDAGLQQLQYLSSLAGFSVPKGSTHVLEGLKRLKDNDADFSKFVKMEFRNVQEFLKSH